ncbi:MAG: FAD-binding oxidoreductase [Bosea sp.]|uniref:NAD(P)/FAD-dependent oxidoreductase n=1 Tax=unclassified Bosea (in: a-proteobacteria) TaxID=2653178 RepID=UPI00095A1650|nr:MULTISPECIES: FAD-binding oxidoreductase [unclassified Bosea (in: a-proteobacteria)]MBN9455255.1 FAD-binding oxidoreductase [Bosea sp. (in: a-proteobacteria)]OJV04887.1 MAG: nopaline dehydrogenase [Bosea sp. 67-29]
MRPDIVVIGGGMVGAAIAYGLARRRQQVLLLDGEDGDFRAARANFGLVWLQGKGLGMPAYQGLTRRSIALWRGFADELQSETGGDLCYEQKGGLAFCLGEDAFEKRRLDLMRLHNQRGEGEADWEMIDRAALERLLPKARLGADVSGASLGRHDGHANPLKLLAGLHGGLLRLGGSIRHRARVERIEMAGSDFRLVLDGAALTAPRIVIAAGLGSARLGRQVGLDVPVHPERGQILVTERLAPFLPLPASGLRQTAEGTVMIGATKDEVGLDVSTTTEAAASLSAKTVRTIPALATARLVRQWAGLRVMTPDSYPVYAQSESHPGAFVALCHSGVTLAAFHAEVLAEAVADGTLPESFSPFHQRRFDVPKAA